jgi:hypothetical protein
MSSSSNNGRKRQAPSAPVYSPNETLNQMTAEAERRQQESSKVQKEAREIRAREMEKQRKEVNKNTIKFIFLHNFLLTFFQQNIIFYFC